MLSDYGSDFVYRNEVENWCNSNSVTYLRSETEGHPWNKCKAINNAVRNVTTKYVVTTDVDMVYDCNPISYCEENYCEKTMYHLTCLWLPQDGDKSKADNGGHAHPGGYQFIATSAFYEFCGYDEKIQYWGFEDWDWPNRLMNAGYEMVWLPDSFKFYHTWHPKNNDVTYRPDPAAFETEYRLVSNFFEPKLPQKNWGSLTTLSDRPILKLLENKPDVHLVYEPNTFQLKDIIESLLPHTLRKKFIIIDFGTRTNTFRPKGWKKSLVHKILGTMPEKIGYLKPSNKNINFDKFYNILPILSQNSLLDYYIESDLSRVYLLFE